MDKNYEMLYQKIVNGSIPERYATPEEQGKAIRRCSILRRVEIEYNPTEKTQNRNYDI